MSDRTAALVSCSRSKRDKDGGKRVSWAMYNSTLFEKSWAAASVMGDPFIMSAKHHLLTVDDRIFPYNKTLKDFTWEEKVEWAETVLSQLPEQYTKIVIFGGRDYVEPIIEVSEREVVDVYKDTTGNGQQMSVAGDIIEDTIND